MEKTLLLEEQYTLNLPLEARQEIFSGLGSYTSTKQRSTTTAGVKTNFPSPKQLYKMQKFSVTERLGRSTEKALNLGSKHSKTEVQVRRRLGQDNRGSLSPQYGPSAK